MRSFRSTLTLATLALLLPACGGTGSDGTPSPEPGVTAAALNGTWAVKEVADDNYPNAEDGLICEYSESGTLNISDGSTGDLELRYTTECTDDSQTELTYNWNVNVSETSELGVFELILDGDDANLDLLCELTLDEVELDCEDEDGDAWRFER